MHYEWTFGLIWKTVKIKVRMGGSNSDTCGGHNNNFEIIIHAAGFSGILYLSVGKWSEKISQMGAAECLIKTDLFFSWNIIWPNISVLDMTVIYSLVVLLICLVFTMFLFFHQFNISDNILWWFSWWTATRVSAWLCVKPSFVEQWSA